MIRNGIQRLWWNSCKGVSYYYYYYYYFPIKLGNLVLNFAWCMFSIHWECTPTLHWGPFSTMSWLIHTESCNVVFTSFYCFNSVSKPAFLNQRRRERRHSCVIVCCDGVFLWQWAALCTVNKEITSQQQSLLVLHGRGFPPLLCEKGQRLYRNTKL